MFVLWGGGVFWVNIVCLGFFNPKIGGGVGGRPAPPPHTSPYPSTYMRVTLYEVVIAEVE
jgi:hypothetical protein